MKVLKIHPEKCTGCLRCELACSYMQTGDYQPAKSVIRVSPFEGHTSYAPYTCTQCAEGWMPRMTPFIPCHPALHRSIAASTGSSDPTPTEG